MVAAEVFTVIENCTIRGVTGVVSARCDWCEYSRDQAPEEGDGSSADESDLAVAGVEEGQARMRRRRQAHRPACAGGAQHGRSESRASTAPLTVTSHCTGRAWPRSAGCCERGRGHRSASLWGRGRRGTDSAVRTPPRG